MAESEMSCNRGALQVIRELVLVPCGKVKGIVADQKNDWCDPFILANLAKKLLEISDQKNIPFLHAIMCGLNLDFFGIKTAAENKFFYNCQYAKTGENRPCIEYDYCESRQDGKYRTFYTTRSSSIAVVGHELVNLNNPELKEMEMTFEGKEAIMIQNAIDLQNLTFVEDYGVEVEAF